jgi:hypothetical protein
MNRLLLNLCISLPLTLVGSWLLVVPAHAEQSTIVVQSVQKDLSYDRNGKLTKHTLLYNEECRSFLEQQEESFSYPVDHFDVFVTTDTRVFMDSSTATTTTSSSPSSSTCQAACLERGVDYSVAHAVMPHRIYNAADASTSTPKDDFQAWFQEHCVKVEVCFMNYHSPQITSYWIRPGSGDDDDDDDDDAQQRQFHLHIEFGERHTKCFHSFIGHQFDIVDTAAGIDHGETGPPILEKGFTILHMTTIAFGTAPPSGSMPTDVDHKVQVALNNEWKRHQVVTRTFSPLGFQKGRLPDDLFGAIAAFYYNNRHNKVLEEWQGKGLFVNWWETNVNFIQIPWRTKGMWQSRLLDMVQAWAGVPIEQTVMYGLRQYEEGARLLTHVDRERTHAVSLIVNVAQGNLTQDWPIEVHDHADRLHEVIMAPGDVVYYESAKCLHGRNKPLRGHNAYYVNLFTHYRPIGDDQWLRRDNPPGTPEPVLQVEGECRVVPDKEYVQCDDPRMGPYVSPALFTAHGGDDLYDWWRATAPEEEDSVSSDSHSALDEL